MWATVHTGKPYSEHNCYWYSDPLEGETLLKKVINSNKSLGSIGVLHSSKISGKELDRPSVKLFIPDSFGDINRVYPTDYSDFVKLNKDITSASGRKIRLRRLILHILKFTLNTIKHPSKNGLSARSIYLMIKTLRKAIKFSEVELIRSLQYILQSSILLHTIKKEHPDVCFLFSNHIAANMHRYWGAAWPEEFDNQKYNKKWQRQKSGIIEYSVWLLDDLIGDIISHTREDTIIVINSGMGQKANKKPDFDRNYDGKIRDMKLFISNLQKFIYEEKNKTINMKAKNNMEPQYGISVQSCKEAQLTGELLKKFCMNNKIKNKIDINEEEIVITIDFFRKDKTMREMEKLYSGLGFEFFHVEDHHTGKHAKEGILWIIDPNKLVGRENEREIELRSTEVRDKLESIIQV